MNVFRAPDAPSMLEIMLNRLSWALVTYVWTIGRRLLGSSKLCIFPMYESTIYGAPEMCSRSWKILWPISTRMAVKSKFYDPLQRLRRVDSDRILACTHLRVTVDCADELDIHPYEHPANGHDSPPRTAGEVT